MDRMTLASKQARRLLHALSEGHSLHDVAELLGVSHTTVAKAVAGV